MSAVAQVLSALLIPERWLTLNGCWPVCSGRPGAGPPTGVCTRCGICCGRQSAAGARWLRGGPSDALAPQDFGGRHPERGRGWCERRGPGAV